MAALARMAAQAGGAETCEFRALPVVHFRAKEELWQLQGKACGSHQIQPPDLRNAALSKKTDNE